MEYAELLTSAQATSFVGEHAADETDEGVITTVWLVELVIWGSF